MPTNVTEFIHDLEGGIFENKLAHILSDVALHTLECGEKNKQGKVTIVFSMSRLAGTTQQVSIDHKIEFSKPTPTGKMSEETTTTSVMHVHKGGNLNVFPENQLQMFDKKGNINENSEES